LRNPVTVTDTYNDAERNGYCYSYCNSNGDSHTYPNNDSKGYPHTKVHSAIAASADSGASPVVVSQRDSLKRVKRRGRHAPLRR
jgi:hypothetical protein